MNRRVPNTPGVLMAAQGIDPSPIRQRKALLRQEQKARAEAADARQLRLESLAISAKLMEHSLFQRAKAVLGFIKSFPEEPDPSLILAFAHNYRIATFLPKLSGSPKKTIHITWGSWTGNKKHLRPGKFGIPEPVGPTVDTASLPMPALCLVPGVAFTREGARLGRGGGYYDRFLAEFPGDTVGMAFSFSIVESLPTESHDIPVGWLATPEGIIPCRRQDPEPGPLQEPGLWPDE